MDTLAVVLLKAGEVEKAQRVMRRLLLKVPRDPTARYHSAMIDVAAGNSNKAKRTISELLQEGSEFPEKAEAEQLLAKIQAED
jgi:Flp pilus assembly protein TadD